MFAKRIRELRSNREYSQEELGRLVDVKKQTVTNWEAGNNYPNPETLIALAKLFNVSTDYLLGVSEEQKPKEKSLGEIMSDRNSNKAKEVYQRMIDAGMDEATIENYVDILVSVQMKKTTK